MAVNLTYEVKLDTLRNNTFAGTYDDISAYVVGFTTNAGQQSGHSATEIDQLVANPASMTMKLDNRSGVFNQETLGAELLANNSFTTWSGGNPSSWTVTGEVGTNPEISQVDMSASHGGSGTGACNIYSTSATVSISQTPLTVGTTYRLRITVTKVTTGVIAVYNGATKVGVYGQEGTFTEYFVAGSTQLKVQNQTAGCNVTIGDVSIKATARYTGLLAPGVIVRVRATYGTTATLFIGKLTEGGIRYGVNQRSGTVDGSSVNVTIQDAMKELLDAEYTPRLQLDVTTADVLQSIFDSAVIPWPYTMSSWVLDASGSSELDTTAILAPSPNLTLDTGRSTFVYAGDVANKNGKGVSAQQYIRDVMMAEAGGRFFWNPRTASWIFHDRYHDALNSTVSATLADTQLTEMDYIYGDKIINKITLNYTIRQIGAADSVLFTLKNAPVKIDQGKTKTIKGAYTNPGGAENKSVGGKDFLTQVQGTDYVVSLDAEGSNITTLYTIVSKPGASAVDITISNEAPSDIYIQSYQIRGTPLIWFNESVEYADAQSLRKYDIKARSPINAKMIDDANFADSLCRYLVGMAKEPRPRLNSISFIANDSATLAGHVINRSIGDRIAVTNSYMNHNANYIIEGERHDYAADSRVHKVTWFLKPANSADVFQLDVVGKSELNVNAILAL